MFLQLSNGPIDRNEEDLQKKFFECLHEKNIFILILQVSDRLDHLISGEYNFFASKKPMRAEKYVIFSHHPPFL